MGELGTVLTYSNVGDLVIVVLCWVDLLYSCPPTRVQDAVVQYSLAAGIQDLRIKDFLCLIRTSHQKHPPKASMDLHRSVPEKIKCSRHLDI
jgi:hypothetical protein